MHPPVQFSNATTIGVLNPDKLAEQVQNIALETSNYDGAGGLDVQPDTSQHRSTFGDLQQLSTSQVGIQGSDHFIPARNQSCRCALALCFLESSQEGHGKQVSKNGLSFFSHGTMGNDMPRSIFSKDKT